MRKIKNLLRNPTLYFVTFLFFLSIYIFRNWIFSSVIASGDFWYYFKSMYQNTFLYPYSWYGIYSTNGLGGSGFAFQNVNILTAFILLIAKALHLSWETVSKLSLFISFLFISNFSSIFLFRKLSPNNRLWIFSPLVFVLNTYILMTVGGGQILTALSYSLMPLSFYLVIKFMQNGITSNTVTKMLITSLILSFQTILDLRIAFVTVLGIFVYYLFSLSGKSLRKIIENTFLQIICLLIVLLINSYWLVTVLFFGINPIAQLGSNYSSTGIVKFLSFGSLNNSIALLHPYWPENIFGKTNFMDPSFLMLPLLAFSSMLFLKENKRINHVILFFSTLALIGIFLAKGSSEPFGNIYLTLFSHVPGFQLFRDSFKWYVLIAISYSFLIPFSINSIYFWIKSNPRLDIFHSNRLINLQNLFLIFVFFYFLFLLRPALMGDLSGTFKNQTIPQDYSQLESYLNNDKSNYRTLWIPNTHSFGYYTNSNPEISGRDFFGEYDQNKLLNKISSSNSQALIDYSGVKYIIVPSDTEKEIYLTDRKYDDNKYKAIVRSLDKSKWLRKEKVFGKIVVYRTPFHRDHFWCDCYAKISYEYINPTEYKVNIQNAKKGDSLVFSENYDEKWVANGPEYKSHSKKFAGLFNSFVLPEGNYSLTIYYKPQKYVDLGVKISIITLAGVLIALIFLHRKR